MMKKHKIKGSGIRPEDKHKDGARFFNSNDLGKGGENGSAGGTALKERTSRASAAAVRQMQRERKKSSADNVEPQSEMSVSNEGKKKKSSVDPKVIVFIGINVLLLAAVIVTVVILNLNVFSVDMTLKGDGEICVEYGDSYEEQGCEAVFHGSLVLKKPRTAQVSVSGEVDSGTVGTYTVSYDAQYTLNYLFGKKLYTNSLQRTVHIVDNEPPVIELTKDPQAFTVPGQPYAEEGFSATDNYDGDITANVVSKEESGKIYYSVSDSSGNQGYAEREIFYDDPYPPEITLSGAASMSITEGEGYAEPGYTAVDNVDGDISANVTVTGQVDPNTAGTYTVTYRVTDGYGNSAETVRTVTVKEYIPPVTIPQGSFGKPQNPNGKVIYLTFDDGPGKHTARLLDILDKYGVKATFFVIKTDYLHLLPRMANSGHTVAMHAGEHDYNKIYASDEAYFNDLLSIQELIRQQTGTTPTILRFPGGSSNRVSRFNAGIMTRLTAKVKEMGYRYYDWNVDSCDAGGTKTAWGVYNNVVTNVPKFKYSVVLQHDIFGYSVDAVEDIIVWGLENGYTFMPLTDTSPVCEHNVKN